MSDLIKFYSCLECHGIAAFSFMFSQVCEDAFSHDWTFTDTLQVSVAVSPVLDSTHRPRVPVHALPLSSARTFSLGEA